MIFLQLLRIETFTKNKDLNSHIITTKGKVKTSRRPSKIPCPGKFDASTGEIHKKLEENLPPKYQDVLV
jgi:hypothetical protein